MSLYGAMFAGVSALNAQSQALGMISDNIANVNTVGYKTNSASFSTLVTRQTSNFYAPGGVRSVPIASIDRQGLLQSSPNATDLAIDGSGFFVTASNDSPTANDARSFTRAGQFTTNKAGYLVTPSGQYLQGWATDSSGAPVTANTSLVGNLESVRVSGVSGSAVATTAIELSQNLPAGDAAGTTHTYNMQIFDSLGAAHDVALTWTKNALPLQWDLSISVPDAGPVKEINTGGAAYNLRVEFNTDGTIQEFRDAAGVVTPAPGEPVPIFIENWTTGASDSLLTLDLGSHGPLGTAIADGLTTAAGTFGTSVANQDGVQFGNFFGVNIDDMGIVSALYTNGQTLKIYKIPIATFPNPNGLDAKNGTSYSESQASGGYFLRAAKEANAGGIVSSALEASNSDIANEFTNMIITQRAYSAATRTITTADEMLDELIRIKR